MFPPRRGPLTGIRVVEFAALGPAPHAAVMLADLGAEVVTVQRPEKLVEQGSFQGTRWRSRVVVEADLKDPEDAEDVRELTDAADVIIEGLRPGVMERLGLGPETLLARTPGLVYARMTGWGQTGPLSQTAGHDINYVGLTGMLHAIGRPDERPVLPLNLVGDFGGGSMFLLNGILAALVERSTSGRGQVIDAAIVDGIAALGHFVWDYRGQGLWSDERGTNTLDGGAPFYDVYQTQDGKYLAVGSLEAKFYAQLLEVLGLDAENLPDQWDPSGWPRLREIFTAVFAGKTRAQWEQAFEGTDACVTPVLSFAEAVRHPQAQARSIYAELGGGPQHNPAPRFSRSGESQPAEPPSQPVEIAAVQQHWSDRAAAAQA